MRQILDLGPEVFTGNTYALECDTSQMLVHGGVIVTRYAMKDTIHGLRRDYPAAMVFVPITEKEKGTDEHF